MIALTTIMIVAIVLVLSLILRSLDIFRFYAFGSDTFANLLYSKRFRGSSLNLYKVGKPVYPPFLPRVLSILPQRLSVKSLHLIPKIFDLLTSLVIFSFSLWFSGDELIAFLALLFYTFSPISVMTGWGIGARSIGSFFFASTLFASYVAIFDPNVRCIMFLLAIVGGILMMFTSRIAYKSYYILAVATIILWPVSILFSMVFMIAIIVFASCLLMTRGEFVNDLKGHIFLINFFRNRLSKKGKKKRVSKRIATKLDVFKFDLWWVLGVFAFVNDINMHTLDFTSLFLSTWLFTMVALSFLWPWGEGERHIMLGTAPASILAASYLSKQPLMIIPLLIIETSIIIARARSLLKGKDLVSVDRHLLNLFNTMKETLEEDSLILCLPPVYNIPVAYFTEKTVLFGESSSREGVLFQAEVLDSLNTEEKLEDLVTKYSVTYLFIDKNWFLLPISSNRWDLILQEKNFVVLRNVHMH